MTRALDLLIGTLTAIALALACGSVIARYVDPMLIVDWSDEVVVMLLIWSMMLSGYRTTIDRAHIAVDLLTHGKSGRKVHVFHIVATSALAAFALAMCVAGTIVVTDAWSLGERTESTARIPTWLYYAALPTGMLLIFIGCARIVAGRQLDPDVSDTGEPL